MSKNKVSNNNSKYILLKYKPVQLVDLFDDSIKPDMNDPGIVHIVKDITISDNLDTYMFHKGQILIYNYERKFYEQYRKY